MNRRHGFTLIELLVYVAIFAIVAGLLTSIFFIIINSQKKASVSGEVSQQLNFVLVTVQRLVGDASLVEAVYEGQSPSSTCATFCTLRLRRTDPTKDPTLIFSNATGIYLQEGSTTQVTLTTNKVLVNNLKFTKNDIPGGHAVVQITTSFSYNTNNPTFAVTKAIESAIARVNAATFDADLIPNQDNTFDIGQIGSNLRWKSGRFSGDLTVGGNVGIGTTSPGTRLTIQPSAYTSALDGIKFQSSDNSIHAIIQPIKVSAGTMNLFMGSNAYVNTSGNVVRFDNATAATYVNVRSDGIRFATGGTSADPLERMQIDSTGNVGIGAAPLALLQLGSDAGTAASGIKFGSVGDTNLYRSAAGVLKTNGSINVTGNYMFNGGGGVDATFDGYPSTNQHVITFASRNDNGSHLVLYSNLGTPSFRMSGGASTGRLDWSGDGGVTYDTNLYRSAMGVLKTDGTFTAAVKNFAIPHPTKLGYTLVHSTLEGPEIAVFYRGTGRLRNGIAAIMLPDYFDALTRDGTATVLLTPRGGRPFPLSYDHFDERSFTVYGDLPSGEFDWEVKATRADQLPLEVERPF